MDELILRHFKERIVAEQQTKHGPRGCRSEHHGAKNRGMHVAHDFFERKEHRGQRSIKCRGDRRSSANRDERFYFFRAQAEFLAENGRDARTDLHGRAFAAERDAASEGRRGTEKLSNDGADGNAAAASEECGFGLRYAAAARVWEKPVQQISHNERADYGNEQSPPWSTADGIEPRARAFRQENEGHYDEADERTDEQGQDEEDLLFTLVQQGVPLARRRLPPRGFCG